MTIPGYMATFRDTALSAWVLKWVCEIEKRGPILTHVFFFLKLQSEYSLSTTIFSPFSTNDSLTGPYTQGVWVTYHNGHQHPLSLAYHSRQSDS